MTHEHTQPRQTLRTQVDRRHRRLQHQRLGRLHPAAQPDRRRVRRRRLSGEPHGAVDPGHPGLPDHRPGAAQDRPRDHRRAGQDGARRRARVRRGRRVRRGHRLVGLQGDRRGRQAARGAGGQRRRVVRPAHARPQLPRLRTPRAQPQRHLRARRARSRPGGLHQPVGRPRHRGARLGDGQRGRLLGLRLGRLHVRRRLRRPDRLLRRRPADQLDHPLHRVAPRRPQVHERGAPLRQDQADHRGQERPHRALGPGGRLAHRRHRRRRHALQRRLPARRRRARRRDRGPVRRQRGAVARLEPARSQARHRDQRRRAGRHGLRPAARPGRRARRAHRRDRRQAARPACRRSPPAATRSTSAATPTPSATPPRRPPSWTTPTATASWPSSRRRP